jgi:hypothetical protein
VSSEPTRDSRLDRLYTDCTIYVDFKTHRYIFCVT